MKKRTKLMQVGAMVALVMGTTFATLPSYADSTVTIAGSATPNLQNFTDLGQAPTDSTMDVVFYLKVNDPNGLANAVRTHQKMNANDFHTKYSPSPSDYNAVVNQLQKAGLSIVSTSDNNLAVAANGTIAQLQSLLGTTIHQFQDSNGNTFLANTTDYQVTGALGAHLAGVTGVNQFSVPKPLLVNQNSATTNNESAAVQSTTANASLFNGNNSAKIQQAYNYGPVYSQGLDGTGQTIAIVDAYGSPTAQADLQQYNQQVEQGAYGANLPLNLTVITPPGMNSVATKNPVKGSAAYDWAGETSMDIQLSHAAAPGANLLLVATPNNQADLYMGVNHVIDKQLANQLSLSFGGAESMTSASERTAIDQIFEQAVVEGINVFVSSGDWGDFSDQLGHPAVSFPASDPNVIAVGGSSLFVDSQGNYQNEIEWGETMSKIVHPDGTVIPGPFFDMGTGGGTSSLFAKPSYQTGVTGLNDSVTYRQVPDVGYDSDPYTGFALVHGGELQDGWGGTSDAAPQWAAICAIANQGHVAKTGQPLPFINPIMYADKQASTHDVNHNSYTVVLKGNVSGNLYYMTMGADESLQATPGWDDTTGLGTPDVNKVVNTLVNSN